MATNSSEVIVSGTKVSTKGTKQAKGKPAKQAKGKQAKGKQIERRATFADNAKITLLQKENPKRGASAKRYALYKSGMSVADYLAKGGWRGDLAWDSEREFIRIA